MQEIASPPTVARNDIEEPPFMSFRAAARREIFSRAIGKDFFLRSK